jgi:NAD(P)-dependent dehydrogenase (short-subunit alcohol dehydrogenase family)
MESSKTILITGAARRLGRALALDFAKAGWQVVVHYNTAETEAKELLKTIEKKGGKAIALHADLNDEKATQALIPKAVKQIGPIHCLINNAAIFSHDTFQSVTRELWDQHLEINLRAPLVLSQAFAAQLPKKTQGNIINMIDQRVWNLTPHYLSYSISKVGLWALTQMLALELEPSIRVNAIGPSITLPHKPETLQHLSNRKLPKEGPSLEELCATAHFIINTPSLNGQMIAFGNVQRHT